MTKEDLFSLESEATHTQRNEVMEETEMKSPRGGDFSIFQMATIKSDFFFFVGENRFFFPLRHNGEEEKCDSLPRGAATRARASYKRPIDLFKVCRVCDLSSLKV